MSIGAHRYQNGVEFCMQDGARAVRVRVSDIALDDLEPWIKRGFDYLGIFHRHRAEIERLAAEKFAAGEIGRNGTVLVRTLTPLRARPSAGADGNGRAGQTPETRLPVSG